MSNIIKLVESLKNAGPLNPLRKIQAIRSVETADEFVVLLGLIVADLPDIEDAALAKAKTFLFTKEQLEKLWDHAQSGSSLETFFAHKLRELDPRILLFDGEDDD